MSKVGIVARNIFDLTEIDVIHEQLKNQGLQFESDEQILECISVAAYSSNNVVNYITEISQLKPERILIE